MSIAEPETFFTGFLGFSPEFSILQYAYFTARSFIIFLPGFVRVRKEPPPRIITNKNISIFKIIFSFFFFFLPDFLLFLILCLSSFCPISSFTCSARELRISFKNSSSLFILIFLYCLFKTKYYSDESTVHYIT